MAREPLQELKKRIKAPKPLRVLINGAATAAFYDLDEEEAVKRVADRLVEVCQSWKQKPGVKFICSFDDDLLMTGDPRGHNRWSIYIVMDVEDLDRVVEMIDDLRQGPVPLWRYFTMAASVGRPFWPIES